MLDLLIALDAVRQWRDDLTLSGAPPHRSGPPARRRRRSVLRLVSAPAARLRARIAPRSGRAAAARETCPEGAVR